MYYAWGWWWFLAWVVPLALVLWALFSWRGRRYGNGRNYFRDDDTWYDEGLGPRIREPSRSNYRGRGPRNYHRADTRIFEDVCDRLMASDQIDASEIEVKVETGKVMLTGRVRSRYEKRLSEMLADSVPGVVDVDNRLNIGDATRAPTPAQTSASMPSGEARTP